MGLWGSASQKRKRLEQSSLFKLTLLCPREESATLVGLVSFLISSELTATSLARILQILYTFRILITKRSRSCESSKCSLSHLARLFHLLARNTQHYQAGWQNYAKSPHLCFHPCRSADFVRARFKSHPVL